MKFTALDVETANSDLSSICQIGIVDFSDGIVVNTYVTLVDPKDYFDGINISIHGITESDVKGAPTFPEVFESMTRSLSGRVVAHHMPFDRISIGRAVTKHRLSPIDCTWLDTARAARRTWERYRQSGYGLANLASEFGITFRHHEAHEDARAAGEILLLACRESGRSIEEWAAPNAFAKEGRISLRGDPCGHLYGETIVFTGALTLTRSKAAQLAAGCGCDVDAGVTARTTLLVVGDQDLRVLAGNEKSGKHRKAENLIRSGQRIRVLCESDFLAITDVGGQVDT